MSEPRYRVRLAIEITGNDGETWRPVTGRVLYDPAPVLAPAMQVFDDILKTLDDRAKFDELHQSDY